MGSAVLFVLIALIGVPLILNLLGFLLVGGATTVIALKGEPKPLPPEDKH